MSRSLQQLGEALYQRISALAKQGELDLAGKVTGMMLDAFPEPELKSLLDDSSALRERVVAAVAMLPREYQDALLPDEAPSPGGPSPTSVMGRLDGFSKEGKLPEPAESDAAEPRAAAALEEGGAVGWASVEAAGGMADCRSFPPERQAAALLQIKTEGAAAKKEREAKRRSKAALSPPATPAAVAKGFDTLAVGDWPALGRRGV
ncbi:hypothetical protein EMIHUDRAFT_196201 [Emiliania huxleyi CCMP1516]|uniref:PABC domain-containing protein n=2 Tax=Emiliania huxleyi TaxID=2903 RepID=A0A0D3J3N2_EMIH1|nr:hypothetical protein EMIHUDRAFT_196201 [Emiliania huxleyi CCMP1516]EOD18117.1 hypothetical protein EMIHUDRAFT_196201 [Emiliania huxleyi CCMP1516]|eukprot:XP_005770546.1 hypothetical protein EMIHUDRAFT_196201 [Emiliania huxleyi CCMP1516]